MGDWVFYIASTHQLACAGQEEMLNVIYYFGLEKKKKKKLLFLLWVSCQSIDRNIFFKDCKYKICCDQRNITFALVQN